MVSNKAEGMGRRARPARAMFAMFRLARVLSDSSLTLDQKRSPEWFGFRRSKVQAERHHMRSGQRRAQLTEKLLCLRLRKP